MRNKDIQEFANIWLEKFKDDTSTAYDLADDFSFHDGCEKCGFKMDSGDSFVEKYGKDFYDPEVFEKRIDEINDIEVLGAAIHSEWRYYNHWAYSIDEIKDPNAVKWFCLAFERLIELAK